MKGRKRRRGIRSRGRRRRERSRKEISRRKRNRREKSKTDNRTQIKAKPFNVQNTQDTCKNSISRYRPVLSSSKSSLKTNITRKSKDKN